MAILRNPKEPEELRPSRRFPGPALEQADTFEFDDPDDVPISESKFHEIQETLQAVYFDSSVPKFVRRRILEASVRATADWHAGAIETAYSSGDREWMLTAVFAMRYVRGFDNQIVEALDSPDPDIHLEAVRAAGSFAVAAAGPHVVALVQDPGDRRVAPAGRHRSRRQHPSRGGTEILADLADSEDGEGLPQPPWRRRRWLKLP